MLFKKNNPDRCPLKHSPSDPELPPYLQGIRETHKPVRLAEQLEKAENLLEVLQTGQAIFPETVRREALERVFNMLVECKANPHWSSQEDYFLRECPILWRLISTKSV